MVRRDLPAYLDGLIDAWHAGRAGRDLHLGYWDDPPAADAPYLPGEFTAAQARLTERAVALVPLRPGERLLDVACGLGSALALLAKRVAGANLVGLNLDRRQLAICRSLAPPAGGSLALVEADAVALPFAAGSFDHVLCVEAMFHFASRAAFIAEAARVLRPGGSLVVTDAALRRPEGAAPWPDAAMVAALRRDYGPWPEPWIAPALIEQHAAAAGLAVAECLDWTAATLPSYRTVAPADPPPEPDAGSVLRWLHHHFCLAYQAWMFRRR